MYIHIITDICVHTSPSLSLCVYIYKHENIYVLCILYTHSISSVALKRFKLSSHLSVAAFDGLCPWAAARNKARALESTVKSSL